MQIKVDKIMPYIFISTAVYLYLWYHGFKPISIYNKYICTFVFIGMTRWKFILKGIKP